MTSADRILDQIDGALADWTVSGDAMRCTPAPEPRTPQVSIMMPDGEWQDIQGVISARFDMEIDQSTIDTSTIQTEAMVDWEEFRQSIVRIRVEQARRAQEFLDALKQAFLQLAPAAARAAEAFRHLPEAAGCNDCGKPARPRDRPAWQSPYGPARRRR